MTEDEFNASWGADPPLAEPVHGTVFTPPEIREPREQLKLVEFYCNLGDERPDVALFELIAAYLQGRSERPVFALTFAYTSPGARGEPAMLVGNLVLGDEIVFEDDTDADD